MMLPHKRFFFLPGIITFLFLADRRRLRRLDLIPKLVQILNHAAGDCSSPFLQRWRPRAPRSPAPVQELGLPQSFGPLLFTVFLKLAISWLLHVPLS